MPWTAAEISFSANPITHMSGLALSIMPVLNGPSCVVVPAKSTTGQIKDAIDKYKATVMVTFPTQLQAFVREMR